MIGRDLASLIFQRGWVSLSGFITILILPTAVTPQEQGLFFTCLSIAALQGAFEAGVTTIFMNFSAHEKAAFGSGSCDLLKGATERLSMIWIAARQWFFFVALLFVAVVGVGGLLYLEGSIDDSRDFAGWRPAYLLLIMAIGVSLSNLGRVSVLEGWGTIGKVAQTRLVANITSAFTLWAFLLLGTGIWALTASYVVQSTLMLAGTSLLARDLPLQVKHRKSESDNADALVWSRDILPLQMRLGASYFCGYFIAQAFVPFAFRYYGPIPAGQIGFANAIYSAAGMVLASLIYLTGPRYAEYIAHRDWVSLSKAFRRTTWISLIAGCVAYAGLIATFWLLSERFTFLSGRLPDGAILLSLGIIGICNIYVGSAATLLRAFKKEPMLPISLVAALLYMVVMLATRDRQPDDLFMLIAAVQLLVILPSTAIVKHRFLQMNAKSI